MLPVFTCDQCNYRTSKRTNYTAHLATQKHKNNVSFICDKCGDNCKNKTGLWRHQKKCIYATKEEEDFSDEPSQALVVREDTTQHGTMLSLIYDLIKQNQEIKELLIQQSEKLEKQNEMLAIQTEKLAEYENRPVVIQQQIQNQYQQQIQNQINHTTNNHFSLNVFLSEKCKGAINMSEFVDNLNIEMGDLEMVGKIGFVDGISRIIVNELNRMDVYQRPIHCTDIKRETIYIKDRDEWKKDTEKKEHTKRVIERVANKNLNRIPEWRRQHPAAEIMDTEEYHTNMNLMIQSIGGLGGTSAEKTAKNQEKIIKQISKNVFIDKMDSLLKNV